MQVPPDWIDLVLAARDGEPAAQSALLVRFTPLVRTTASRLIDVDHVDDVVQDTFAEALRSLGSLRTPEAFPTWLRLIARKQAHRARGTRSSGLPPDLEVPADRSSDPDAVSQHRELADIVRVALRSVRDADRRLIELRYLAGWTNTELAGLLGISDGAVRKRLHDARQRLRPHLEHLRHPEPQETTMPDFERFLDTVHPADIAVPDAPALGVPEDAPTTTGLRIIDAIAPIRRGGTVELVGPAGTGQLVLALELLYRLGRTEHDITCVAVGAAGGTIGSRADLGHVVTEPGIPGPNAAILTRSSEEAATAFAAGARLAGGLASTGRDVVLVVDAPTLAGLPAGTLQDAAGLADEGAVTVMAIRALDRGTDVPETLGLDTTVVFSLEQFALGIFPAVDPVQSSSTFARSTIAQAAVDQLRAAADLRAWFAQPMHVAEDFTGEAGTWSEPADAAAALARLVG